ncbi:MAG: DUF6125 family protein [Spirochaetota bacterium]|nr:DUF6125 family protein [Spirochaetota bacterium]HPV97517.1 DUF6125 family protein [Spirochaetota bacterium]
MEINDEQLERLRLGALTAIDGLWFLELEKRFGFEKALEIDLEVWKSYGVVLLKRIARMNNVALDPGKIMPFEDVLFFIGALSRIDGTEYSARIAEDGWPEFRVDRCPWYENLKGMGREKLVPCEMIDDTIFGHWLGVLDESLSMEFVRSRPRGDDHCAWRVRRAAGQLRNGL